MKELYNAIPKTYGPATQDQDFIVVRHYCDFEGHGRASETWEKHWEIKFPHLQKYWKGSSGEWHRCNEGVTPRFHARSFEGAKNKALEFLENAPLEPCWKEFPEKPWLEGMYDKNGNYS